MKLGAAAALLYLATTAAVTPAALAGSWSTLGGPVAQLGSDASHAGTDLLVPLGGSPWAVYSKQQRDGKTSCVIKHWVAGKGWAALAPALANCSLPKVAAGPGGSAYLAFYDGSCPDTSNPVSVMRWRPGGRWKAVGPRCFFKPEPDTLTLAVRANGHPVVAMNIEKVEMGFLVYPRLSYWDGSTWTTVGDLGWYDLSSVIVRRMYVRGKSGGWPAETALIFAQHAYDGSWQLLTFDFSDYDTTGSAGTLWYGGDFQGGSGDVATYAQDAAGDVWIAVHAQDSTKVHIARIVRKPNSDIVPEELPAPPVPPALPDPWAAFALAVGVNRTAFLAYQDGTKATVKQFSQGAWRAVGPARALPGGSALMLAAGRRSSAPIAAIPDAKGQLVAYIYKSNR